MSETTENSGRIIEILYFSVVFEELNTIYGADSQAMLLQDTGILRTGSVHLIYSLFLILIKKILMDKLFLVFRISPKFFSKTFDACLLPMVYTKVWYKTTLDMFDISLYHMLLLKKDYDLQTHLFLKKLGVPASDLPTVLFSHYAFLLSFLLESQSLLVSPATTQLRVGHGPF